MCQPPTPENCLSIIFQEAALKRRLSGIISSYGIANVVIDPYRVPLSRFDRSIPTREFGIHRIVFLARFFLTFYSCRTRVLEIFFGTVILLEYTLRTSEYILNGGKREHLCKRESVVATRREPQLKQNAKIPTLPRFGTSRLYNGRFLRYLLYLNFSTL